MDGDGEEEGVEGERNPKSVSNYHLVGHWNKRLSEMSNVDISPNAIVPLTLSPIPVPLYVPLRTVSERNALMLVK